jgi:hypothetical protein
MKVKLIYKDGIGYDVFPPQWFNKDRVYLPRRKPISVIAKTDEYTSPVLDEHVFQHIDFEKINGEIYKVMQEI